jgi:hypothetical protein
MGGVHLLFKIRQEFKGSRIPVCNNICVILRLGGELVDKREFKGGSLFVTTCV